MKHDTFSAIVENRQGYCRRVLTFKDNEYSSSADRLHNFKAAGRMSNCSPELALWGMLAKHLVSVKDEIDRMDENVLYCPTAHFLDEKVVDCINYLHLLEGLVVERLDTLANRADVIMK